MDKRAFASSGSVQTAFGLLIAVTLCIMVYLPGLGGQFMFDDTANIIKNRALTQTVEWNWQQLIGATLSSDAGPLKRPVSMFTLAVNHIYSGLDPFAYKFTNLVIHLLTGLGIFALTIQLLRATERAGATESITRHQQVIALITASLWLLHPFNLTPVLYIIQRMTALSALFTVWGIFFYLTGRLRLLQGKHGAGFIISSMFPLGALAILSKENAALLPVFLLTIEWIFFRFEAFHAKSRTFIKAFTVLVLLAPVISGLAYQILNWDALLASYNYRPFTLLERLMTEARVVWFYVQMTVLPDINQMSLYHDDIIISKGLTTPPATIFALSALSVLLLIAVIFRKQQPILAFGILFFLIGHSMESSFYSLEITHEHRNYLPAFSLMLIITYYSGKAFRALSLARRIILLISLLVPALLSAMTFVRADLWTDNFKRSAHEVSNHPQSSRSHNEMGHLYAQLAEEVSDIKRIKYLGIARNHYNASMQLDNYTLIGDLALIAIDGKLNNPLNQELIEKIELALREAPMAPASVTALLNLSQCQHSGSCNLPEGIIDRLLAAALDNPTLTRLAPINLLIERSQHAMLEGDFSSALKYAERATTELPDNAQLHLNYASILHATGDIESAKTHLIEAKRNDIRGIYATRIKTMDRLLEK